MIFPTAGNNWEKKKKRTNIFVRVAEERASRSSRLGAGGARHAGERTRRLGARGGALGTGAQARGTGAQGALGAWGRAARTRAGAWHGTALALRHCCLGCDTAGGLGHDTARPAHAWAGRCAPGCAAGPAGGALGALSLF